MIGVVTFKSSSQPLKASSKIIPIFYLLKKKKSLRHEFKRFDTHGIQRSISCRRHTFEAEYWITRGGCTPKKAVTASEAWSPARPSRPRRISAEL